MECIDPLDHSGNPIGPNGESLNEATNAGQSVMNLSGARFREELLLVLLTQIAASGILDVEGGVIRNHSVEAMGEMLRKQDSGGLKWSTTSTRRALAGLVSRNVVSVLNTREAAEIRILLPSRLNQASFFLPNGFWDEP